MKKRGGVEEVSKGYLRLLPASLSSSSVRKGAASELESNSAAAAAEGEEEEVVGSRKKPGGWKTMPYIIGNETFERVASFGLTANFTVYLVKRYHIQQVAAANLTNIWTGTTNFAPLLGAFISDAYWGKFKTLAYACVATFLGMIAMTLTAAVRELSPPACSADGALPSPQQQGQCAGPTGAQLSVLIVALALLTIGAGGVRPCNLPFGMDQFDRSTEEGRKGMNSYFNWYYTTNTAAVMVALTVVVYVQDSVSWVLGLGIPTVLMLLAIVLFFLGTRLYVYVAPEGSVFTRIVQVFVAAYKKRKLRLPSPTDQEATLFNPPPPPDPSSLKTTTTSPPVVMLPLTQQFSFLNKAAIKLDGDVNPNQVDEDGSGASSSPRPSVNPWRICSVQQIEEVKCLIRIVPIWASGITCFVALAQQWTMAVLQSLTMDRHLGPHFQVPPGSLGVISLLAIVIFLPFYDLLLVPLLRRITKHEAGITLLQRMGVGIFISMLSMVVAGLVEEKRRAAATTASASGNDEDNIGLSVMWLVPQLALVGISEAFNAVGQIEFYNQQFPDQMRSIATSLFSCSLAGANYLSSLVVLLVQKNTGKNGRPNWLDNNINAGRLDYFYYLLAGMGGVNLLYFLVCAHFYRYKGHIIPKSGEQHHHRQQQQEQQAEAAKNKVSLTKTSSSAKNEEGKQINT